MTKKSFTVFGRNLKSFTLVEILAVIAVLGVVFSGLGYANFRDFSKRQVVDNSYRVFITDLRTAQKNSSVGDKADVCLASDTLKGYRFTFTRPSNSSPYNGYTVKVLCGSQVVTFKQVTLPTGVTFSSVPSTVVDFVFKPLGQGTDINLSGGSATVIMSYALGPSAIYTRSIYIYSSGEIQEF